MKISTHFNREEFKCKCGKCNFIAVDSELLKVLEVVRIYFNQPLTINSAWRCKAHNKAVGGKEHSKHLLGIAADIVVKDVSPEDVYTFLNHTYKNRYGIGKYDSFTHIDVRELRSRW